MWGLLSSKALLVRSLLGGRNSSIVGSPHSGNVFLLPLSISHRADGAANWGPLLDDLRLIDKPQMSPWAVGLPDIGDPCLEIGWKEEMGLVVLTSTLIPGAGWTTPSQPSPNLPWFSHPFYNFYTGHLGLFLAPVALKKLWRSSIHWLHVDAVGIRLE